MKKRSFIKGLFNKEFLISIACYMLIQAITFTIVKFFQTDYHVMMLPIDDKIPFIPHFIYIYNIFYPFVFLVFYIVFRNDKEKYYHGIRAGILGYVIADIIFLIYPTIMIRPSILGYDIDFITANFIKLTYYIDNPALNCFPSIHCIFCFQTAFTALISKNIKLLNKLIIIIISLLIIISTLLVKQHYIYDVIGAFVIFIASNYIAYLFRKNN